ncbi:hypothetical protein ACTFIY_004420 [Dictyostelium cf. discoideum]
MKSLLVLIVFIFFIKQSYSEYCGGTYCPETRNCFNFVGCSNTTCLYSEKDTDDYIGCTVDSCDDEIGIINAEDDSLCPPDSLFNCPEPNICQIPLGCIQSTGECKFTQIDCDDDNDCTDDSCDTVLGCVHVSNSSNCVVPSNLSLCFTNPRCGEFSCEFDEINCDDGNPCSDDSCVPETVGCFSELNDLNCFTENQCQTSVCTSHGCVNTPINCDDGNPCSDDSCVPETGCKSTLNNLNCNDGNKCTIDQCISNGCTYKNVICPPKKVSILGLIGLFCKNHYCELSTGNCIPDYSSSSLLCAP